MEEIIKGIFGFYFSAIDAFFGRPDSLEAMLIFCIFALVLMMVTIAVPTTLAVMTVLYHFGSDIIEVIFKIAKVIKAVRKVLPIWACVFAALVIWPVGMAFGAIGIPSYPYLAGSIYTTLFVVLLFGGVWTASKHPTDERYVLVSFGVGVVTMFLSIPFFPWAILPVVAITTAFWGLFGLTIQTIIKARLQKVYRC